jgi:hypothetical protein
MVPAGESLDMNVLAVPALVSLVATGFLVLGVGAGMVLQLSQRLAPAGKSLLWYSSTSLFLAIIFAWVGLFTLAPVLGLAVGERGFFFGLLSIEGLPAAAFRDIVVRTLLVKKRDRTLVEIIRYLFLVSQDFVKRPNFDLADARIILNPYDRVGCQPLAVRRKRKPVYSSAKIGDH